MKRDAFWILAALTFGRCAYDSGHRAGVEDGWWTCASEYGVVG